VYGVKSLAAGARLARGSWSGPNVLLGPTHGAGKFGRHSAVPCGQERLGESGFGLV
jgi:hypothetical protein